MSRGSLVGFGQFFTFVRPPPKKQPTQVGLKADFFVFLPGAHQHHNRAKNSILLCFLDKTKFYKCKLIDIFA